jgi:hypothetical protein
LIFTPKYGIVFWRGWQREELSLYWLMPHKVTDFAAPPLGATMERDKVYEMLKDEGLLVPRHIKHPLVNVANRFFGLFRRPGDVLPDPGDSPAPTQAHHKQDKAEGGLEPD